MATMRRPIKKAQSGTKEVNSFATAKGLPIPRHDLSGTNGAYATGVQISDKDFKKNRKDFEYLDTPKSKPMKKLTAKKPLMKTTPMKRTPMKKGGTISKAKTGKTVNKAFLGSLLGGAGGAGMLGGLLGGGGGGMLGGLLGGGGGKGGAEGAGMSKISKMFSGSMKKGGKVVAKKKIGMHKMPNGTMMKNSMMKKAKTGTSLGMKSVKAGYDKNPGVTRADIITAATKKAKSGTSMKKMQYGGKAASMVPPMKSGGSMKKCKYGCK